MLGLETLTYIAATWRKALQARLSLSPLDISPGWILSTYRVGYAWRDRLASVRSTCLNRISGQQRWLEDKLRWKYAAVSGPRRDRLLRIPLYKSFISTLARGSYSASMKVLASTSRIECSIGIVCAIIQYAGAKRSADVCANTSSMLLSEIVDPITHWNGSLSRSTIAVKA